jgi:hypothetical protein
MTPGNIQAYGIISDILLLETEGYALNARKVSATSNIDLGPGKEQSNTGLSSAVSLASKMQMSPRAQGNKIASFLYLEKYDC